MQIPVLVERLPGKGFRARGGEPFALAAEGATRDEAVERLQEMIDQRIRAGAEVRTLEVSGSDHPWLRLAGTLKDEPLFDEWQQAIGEYRHQRDNDLDVP
jgi:hypothetical protein